MHAFRKLASVGPFLHQEAVAGSPLLLERSISDPTVTIPAGLSPPIQRVTPTVRTDTGSLPELLASKLTGYAEPPYEGCAGVGSSEDEQEGPTSSPKCSNVNTPVYSEDYNLLFSSTPMATVGPSRFRTERSPVHPSIPSVTQSELESRLKVQTDINRELKRLLVASMGSDLQHRLNQIAEEKATISQDLDASLQQLAENYEEIDRVSIECDVWRSKFLASRLMIDELAIRKAEVSRQLRESQKALHHMLKEHAELSNLLIQCDHNLNQFATYFEAKSSSGIDSINGWSR